MDFKDICDIYYNNILNFCYLKLGDRQLAEDCTQEVFLALSRKMHRLPLDTDVSKWLINAAKIEIKECCKKRHDDISINEIADIPANDSVNEGILDDILSDEEYISLSDYYVKGKDIAEISKENKVSVPAMYQRLNRIKKKILKSMSNTHKSSKK